ncbi:DNA topoisomerase IB [Allonocardiopsis opalescens]|uniref:DNA topoisomerase n=1 Tax=Allonocardiopsis opalescens TaxID=1144618 RepID=A0A2T0QE50_9ACTN|nr:DNA topoisomerase IB [Allonocardiopsis opalescens]PRY02185.1 DNA topoisomerase IB [Allonocardiopsis opalescens]
MADDRDRAADAPRELARAGLRPSSPDEPGYTRRRHGRGFRYFAPDGRAVTDHETKARLKDLVIPPAWTEVWICVEPDGHVQAVGTDDAGRRQYLYHPRWRALRDRAKHDRVLDFAERLPEVRERVAAGLDQGGLGPERVLAGSIRLVDLGFFRSGGESYADENDTYGVATLLREHVSCTRGRVVFDYPAKGGRRREVELADDRLCALVTALKRRRAPGPELLAYRVPGGWHDVRSEDVNGYLRELAGPKASVKDFRTWHATVLAAVGVAVSTDVPRDSAGRQRAEARVVSEVAEYLGNTPAVARASYIDPRVFELYRRGVTIRSKLPKLAADASFGELSTGGPVEDAVRTMLRRARD